MGQGSPDKQGAQVEEHRGRLVHLWVVGVHVGEVCVRLLVVVVHGTCTWTRPFPHMHHHYLLTGWQLTWRRWWWMMVCLTCPFHVH